MAPTRIRHILREASPLFEGGAALDLVALQDVKSELQIEDRTDDAWLRKQITRASQTISRHCGRVFQVRRVLEEIWPFRDPYPWQLPANLGALQLGDWPVSSPASFAFVAAPDQPAASAEAGGTLSPGIYCIRASYVTATGETAVSAPLWIAATNGSLVVQPPEGKPTVSGWNCYIGTNAVLPSRQNGDPLSFEPFALSAPLIAGAAAPDYVLVTEQAQKPYALAEGRDFEIARERGEIMRLFSDGYVSKWPVAKIAVEYSAGYAEIPDDLQDACIDLVKARWFARTRDPMLRDENIEGVYSASYWFGTGPGAPNDLPAYVADKLSRFRVPVIA